jgi:hypothetical protein
MVEYILVVKHEIVGEEKLETGNILNSNVVEEGNKACA